MPRGVNRTKAAAIGEVADEGSLISRHPREFVGIVLAGAAVLAVYANALFMQKGPHPAPIFAARPLAAAPTATAQPRSVTPGARSAAVASVSAPLAPPVPMSRVQLIVEIQHALNRRGFYDGVADGIWGAKTDAGVRDFVRAARLNINPEASEEILRALSAVNVTARTATPPASPRNDPIAALIAPSQRVLAIQHALSEFGYGQITPTGTYDPATRTAIEKFERDRNLPVTGDISDRFVRELAAMTGRPLE